MTRWTADDISDRGERVSHLQKDFVFFGHLSIYAYATAMGRGACVLDVGCGSGYGSAHLADHGATSVLGVDANDKAIAFCRQHFVRPNLEFRTLRAEAIGDLPPESVDLIFTSNTLEHVEDPAAFFQGAWATLRPTGALLLAVPPITTDRLLYENLINPNHLNLWSPRQWGAIVGTYFDDVTPVLHGVRTLGGGPTAEDLVGSGALDEKSFVFADGRVADMYAIPTLTAIFVARRPRAGGVPHPGDPIHFVDESFSRKPGTFDPEVARRLRAGAPSPASALRDRLARAMTIWRTQGTMTLIQRTARALGRRHRGQNRRRP